MVKFGMDDGYTVGPSSVLFLALEIIANAVEQQCLLVWENQKLRFSHGMVFYQKIADKGRDISVREL